MILTPQETLPRGGEESSPYSISVHDVISLSLDAARRGAMLRQQA